MKCKIFWLSAITCNGNIHSFLNYPQIEQFLEDFEFVYNPLFESKANLEAVVSRYHETDILVIEGAISEAFLRGGKSIIDIINMYAPYVKKIVTVGTCATFGGIFRQSPYLDVRGVLFDETQSVDTFARVKDKVVSVSGCPIHPEVLANTLYMIKNEMTFAVDHYHRPKPFFGYTVHNGCTRNEYFEYKVDKHQFGEKEGCMFYDHGCQAPYTHGSCNKILWNEVNSKTRAGQPCMGCTEPDFPKIDLFNTKKNMGIPQYLPLGIAKRTYITLAGVVKAFKIERFEQRITDE
ncbi:MAG: hydrogenase [Epsilonproteobacteria bacterium]|nr:hydrogenase [Campylobacterota bacterium]